jgi:hypothetical protein
VCFRGEVHHRARSVLRERGSHRLAIGDIGLDERHVAKIGDVQRAACVGQLVD